MNTKAAEASQSNQAVPAVKTAGTDLAVYDPGADAGAGMEDITRDEYAVPFLYVLDAKSPQCAPPTAGGIPGAKAGMLFNKATGELYDGEAGVGFIPVMRDHNFGEWIPRNPDGSGGGFVGIRAPEDPLVTELRAKHGQFGKLPTSEGHELVETFYLYGLVVREGTASPVYLPFKSTSIAAYKNFMTRVMSITYLGPDGKPARPALYAHLWKLGTQYRPAKQAGQSGWYIPKLNMMEEPAIKSRLKLTDPLYVQARELYQGLKEGRIKAEAPDAKQAQTDSEIPF